MTAGDVILTRDRSSGRFHKRVRIGKGLATLEQCNQDNAGEYDILFDLPDGLDPKKLCRRCFAEPVTTIRTEDVPEPVAADQDDWPGPPA